MSPQCVRHMKVLWYAGRSMAANFREPIFPSGEPAQRFLGDLETNSLGSGLAAVAQCEEWLFWLFSADGDGYVLGKFPGSLFLLLWVLTFLHLLPPPSSSFFFFYYFIFLTFLLYLFPLLSPILSIVSSVSSLYFFSLFAGGREFQLHGDERRRPVSLRSQTQLHLRLCWWVFCRTLLPYSFMIIGSVCYWYLMENLCPLRVSKLLNIVPLEALLNSIVLNNWLW